MLDAYLYDGLRSPIGRHAGKLAPLVPTISRGGHQGSRGAQQGRPGRDQRHRARLRQPGGRGRATSRASPRCSPLPPTTPGVTVNRLCASGLQAVSTPRAR